MVIDEKGVDIHASENCGQTILHYAAKIWWYPNLVMWLVEVQHADLDAINNEGQNPCEVAREAAGKVGSKTYDYLRSRKSATQESETDSRPQEDLASH
jgi:hypothetical protein